MEDPWILTLHAKPAMPNVPVVHPIMTVRDFIIEDSKEWNVAMFENFVAHEDIPSIRSLAISRSLHRDTYC